MRDVLGWRAHRKMQGKAKAHYARVGYTLKCIHSNGYIQMDTFKKSIQKINSNHCDFLNKATHKKASYF